jgi:hypothetical protein
LNPKCPAELERIINKALEKDRTFRYQSASEMGADLRRLKRDAEPGRLNAEVPMRKSPKPIWLATAILLLTMIATGLWFRLSRNETPEGPLIPVPFTTFQGEEWEPSFSPDGNQVAFSWNGVNPG